MSSSQEVSYSVPETLEEPRETLIENSSIEQVSSDGLKLGNSQDNKQENKEKEEEKFIENASDEKVLSDGLKLENPKENKETEEESSGEEELLVPKIKVKRKRKLKDDPTLDTLTEEFLNLYYPISKCLSKQISIGISNADNCTPMVTLRQGTKKVKFCEKAWESFNKYLNLIECYLTNRVNGKKTNIVLDHSDIEVENIKMRGDQYVKFRDVTKHEEKITLSPDEFEMLVTVAPAINRYMKQLKLALPMIKDYLRDTLESVTPLLYGPVDVSIYNRLPQEVYVFRRMKARKIRIEKEEEEQEEERNSCYSNWRYQQDTNYLVSQEHADEVDDQPLTQTY